jgi:methyl-accepting chemotaxis protein
VGAARIAVADLAYRAAREGRLSRRRIRHGEVVSTWPWAGLRRSVRDSALVVKIGLLLAPTLAAMSGIALLLFGGETYQLESRTLAGCFVAGGVLQTLVAGWFWHAIRTPLRQAAGALQAVAEGDYSVRLDIARNDEVGVLLQAVTAMQTKLGFIVTEVRQASASMDEASTEMALGNQNLSARTEEQALRLEETANAMGALTESVRRNAAHAGQANELAAGASEVASQGGQAVGEVVTTMRDITESSKKIADIIGVIDGIAYQTNILALNAAVEAARAGEQGRGFAVVANEVRNLAQRSALAAAEIKALIEDSVGKVEQGAQQVDRAGQTMSDIVASVQQVAAIMAEITTASAAQSAGLEQVNQAVTQMDQMTQQNAALVEEAAAAAAAMRQQSATLAGVVAHLSGERHSGADVGRGARGQRRASRIRKAA